MAGDDRRDQTPEEALPMLRWLRILVTSLAVVMGLGMMVVAALLWLRLSQPPLPELPPQVELPQGARPAAITFARDWLVVVTETGEVLLYDRQGRLQQRRQP
ncbi:MULTISPECIES: DUF6476 family protein [unclassified Paracoccus (in: a-proteobacteria)]|uniref:DUF6476 family protein n=1 Tax=unclassified Paracoccus (in: a-proteobacteria) TaxID=2688777 RepID=UPI001E4B355C|nr:MULTISPECIES: DUF6476 family protein [unclassified Paracoccus (in: a-proteobacteria)]UXU75185.1 DUF6476 family protein [Paracoccus sp. SMMA_5]UXU81087.1 DUF6476 family protein [Paracoccus sp. SMMA_5_TC]